VSEDVISYAMQMPGVTDPFPNIFDPLNLLGTVGSSNTKIRELRRWREAEVTHGRVAMLASLGWLTQEAIENWSGSPFPHVTGPALTHFQQVEAKGAIFWEPLVLAIGIAESYRVAVGWNDPTSANFYSLRDDYEPGNLGFDPLGLLPQDPQEKKDMQSKELNNGRLAMIAIVAFAVQEILEPKFVFEQLGERLGK
jgi:light-harvesting complex I chlorophyll a/b binding protein 1